MAVAGELTPSPYDRHPEDDDFVQPRALYQTVLSEEDREHLVSTSSGTRARA